MSKKTTKPKNKQTMPNKTMPNKTIQKKPLASDPLGNNQSKPNTTHKGGELVEPVVAKPMIRLVAIVYDGMLILALLFIIGTVLSVIGTLTMMETGTTSQEAQKLPEWYQNLIMTPSFVLTLVWFYGIFWKRAGQTLGMQTWRLKTVTAEGHLLGWKQTFIRILSACIIPVVCGFIGWITYDNRITLLFSAFIGMLFNYGFCWMNRRGLAVHDILSNSITLKMPKIHHKTLWHSFKNRKKKK